MHASFVSILQHQHYRQLNLMHEINVPPCDLQKKTHLDHTDFSMKINTGPPLAARPYLKKFPEAHKLDEPNMNLL